MHLAAAGPYRRGDREADEAGPNDDSALRANRSGYEVTAVSCGAQIVHMWEGGAGNIEMNRARPSGEEERIVGAAAAVRQNHLSCGRAEYSAGAIVDAGMVPRAWIGRASRRARMRQYVWISVVGVALKNKQINRTSSI